MNHSQEAREFIGANCGFRPRQFSKLEWLITQHESSRVADRLVEILQYMLSLPELLDLRFVCKIFERWVTSSSLFGTLYVDPWYTCTKDQQWPALQNISPLCRQLIVNLPTSGPPCHASTGIVFDHSPSLSSADDWPAIFSTLTNLQALTLRTPPSRLGHSTQSYSAAGFISHLRQSFEQSTTKCTTLRAHLFDAALLPFLKPCGPSYGSAKWLARGTWAAITVLELQLLPPARRAQSDTVKILHCWLLSFEQRLRVLRFAWAWGNGANRGPHPLALDLVLRARSFSQKPVEFKVLRELWVGNCAREESVRGLVRFRAAVLERYLVLMVRAGQGDLLAFDEEREKWEEVSIDEVAATEESAATLVTTDGELSMNSYDEVLDLLRRMEYHCG